MKSVLAVLAVAAGGLALPTAMAADASAARPSGHEALTACKADAEKLCAGVQPGEGRIQECFKQHRKDLSPECRKELAAAHRQRKN